jgi:hypothetical protein
VVSTLESNLAILEEYSDKVCVACWIVASSMTLYVCLQLIGRIEEVKPTLLSFLTLES